MIRHWQTYRNKIIILTDQAIVSGVSFLLSILLVRFTDIHVFGEFALVLIVAQGVVAINQSIITSPYQSLWSDLQIDKYLKMLKSMQLLIILAILLLLSVVQFVTFNYDLGLPTPVILPAFVYFVGVVLFDFNRKQMYLEERYGLVLLKDAIVMVSQVMLIIVAHVWFQLSTVQDVLWILGGTYLVVDVFFFFYTGFVDKPTLELILKHWHFGKWMLGNSALQWFSGNLYITVGATLLGAEMVGVVRIGQSIIGVWNVFIQSLENYVPPLAAKIYRNNGWEGVSKYLFNLGVKGGLMVSLVGVVLIVFRNQIWELFYGDALLNYTFVLYWFAPILLFNFLGFPFRFAIRTLSQTRILFEAYILSSLMGFATAHWWINSLGIHGICLGLLATQVIMQLWYYYRLTQFTGYGNHSYSLR